MIDNHIYWEESIAPLLDIGIPCKHEWEIKVLFTSEYKKCLKCGEEQ